MMIAFRRPSLLLFSLLLLIGVIFAPVFAPFDPLEVFPQNTFTRPSPAHPFGTDAFGRDVLSRVLVGAQITVGSALVSTAIVVLIGGSMGLVAGATGGAIDRLIGTFIQTLLAFPTLLIALVVIALIGQGGYALIVAVVMSQLALYTQYARAVARGVRAQEYITCVEALGATRWRVLTRHILPNCAPQLLGFGGVILGYCVLTGAGLGFLGVVGEPGQPEWGVLLAEGRQYLRVAPWISTAPGVAITGFVLIVNLTVDSLTRPAHHE